MHVIVDEFNYNLREGQPIDDSLGRINTLFKDIANSGSGNAVISNLSFGFFGAANPDYKEYQKLVEDEISKGASEEEAKEKVNADIKSKIMDAMQEHIYSVVDLLTPEQLQELLDVCGENPEFTQIYIKEVLVSAGKEHFDFAFKRSAEKDENDKVVGNKFYDELAKVLVSKGDISPMLCRNLSPKLILMVEENNISSKEEHENFIKNITLYLKETGKDEVLSIELAQNLISNGYKEILSAYQQGLGISDKDFRLIDSYLEQGDFEMIAEAYATQLASDEAVLKAREEVEKFNKEQIEKMSRNEDAELLQSFSEDKTNAESIALIITDHFLEAYKEGGQVLEEFMSNLDKLPMEIQAACFGVFIEQDVNLEQMPATMDSFVNRFKDLDAKGREYFVNHVILKTSIDELVNQGKDFLNRDVEKHGATYVQSEFFSKVLELRDEEITKNMLLNVLDKGGKGVFDIFIDNELVSVSVWKEVIRKYGVEETIETLVTLNRTLVDATLELVIELNGERPELLMQFAEQFVMREESKQKVFEFTSRALELCRDDVLQRMLTYAKRMDEELRVNEFVNKHMACIAESYIEGVHYNIENGRNLEDSHEELIAIAKLSKEFANDALIRVLASDDQGVINSVVSGIASDKFPKECKEALQGAILTYAEREDSAAKKIANSVFRNSPLEFQIEFLSAVIEEANLKLLDSITQNMELSQIHALINEYGIDNAVGKLPNLNDKFVVETLRLAILNEKDLSEFVENFSNLDSYSKNLSEGVMGLLLNNGKNEEIAELISKDDKFAGVIANAYIEGIKDLLGQENPNPVELSAAIKSLTKDNLEVLQKLPKEQIELVIENIFNVSDLSNSTRGARLNGIRNIIYNIDLFDAEIQKHTFTHLLDNRQGMVDALFSWVGVRDSYDFSRDVNLIFAKNTEESNKSLSIYLDLLLERNDYEHIAETYAMYEKPVLTVIEMMPVEKQAQIFENLPEVGLGYVTNTLNVDPKIKDAVYAKVIDEDLIKLVKNGSQEDKSNALMKYAALGDLNAVKVLVHEGAEINAQGSYNGFTPLMYAVSYDFQAHGLVNDELLQSKHGVNATQFLEKEFRVLDRSEGCKKLMAQKAAVVKYLLNEAGASPHIVTNDKNKLTALQINEIEGTTKKAGAIMYLGDPISNKALVERSTNIDYDYIRSHRVQLFMLRGLNIGMNTLRTYCPPAVDLVNNLAFPLLASYTLGSDPMEFVKSLPAIAITVLKILPMTLTCLEYTLKGLYNVTKKGVTVMVGENISSKIFYLPDALGKVYSYVRGGVVAGYDAIIEKVPKSFKDYLSNQQKGIWNNFGTLSAIMGIYAADKYVNNTYFGLFGGNPASLSDNALMYFLYVSTTYEHNARAFGQGFVRDYAERQRSLTDVLMIGSYDNSRWGGELQERMLEHSLYTDVEKGIFTAEQLQEKLDKDEVSVEVMVEYLGLLQGKFDKLEKDFSGRAGDSKYQAIREEMITAHTALMDKLINLDPELYVDEVERANAYALKQIIGETFGRFKAEIIANDPEAEVHFLGYVQTAKLNNLVKVLEMTSGNIKSAKDNRGLLEKAGDMLKAGKYYVFDAAEMGVAGAEQVVYHGGAVAQGIASVFGYELNAEQWLEGVRRDREQRLESMIAVGGTARAYGEAAYEISVVNIGFKAVRGIAWVTVGIATTFGICSSSTAILALTAGAVLLYFSYLCYSHGSILGGGEAFTAELVGFGKDTIEAGQYIAEDIGKGASYVGKHAVEAGQYVAEKIGEGVSHLGDTVVDKISDLTGANKENSQSDALVNFVQPNEKDLVIASEITVMPEVNLEVDKIVIENDGKGMAAPAV